MNVPFKRTHERRQPRMTDVHDVWRRHHEAPDPTIISRLPMAARGQERSFIAQLYIPSSLGRSVHSLESFRAPLTMTHPSRRHSSPSTATGALSRNPRLRGNSPPFSAITHFLRSPCGETRPLKLAAFLTAAVSVFSVLHWSTHRDVFLGPSLLRVLRASQRGLATRPQKQSFECSVQRHRAPRCDLQSLPRLSCG